MKQIILLRTLMLAASLSAMTLTTLDVSAQVNMLETPGAEGSIDGWEKKGRVWLDDNPVHSGTFSFGIDDGGGLSQRVGLSLYAKATDLDRIDLVLEAAISTEDDTQTVSLTLEFQDQLGLKITEWEQLDITSPGGWSEQSFTLQVPALTRAVLLSFYCAKTDANANVDDLRLSAVIRELEPTPTPTPTPTATPMPEEIVADFFYAFNQPQMDDNGFIAFPAGNPGDFDFADVFMRPLLLFEGEEIYSDGFGLSVIMDGGEGAIFFADPIYVGDNYVFMRISVQTSDSDISLALGGLDSADSSSLAGANLNGSIGMNLMQKTLRFKNQFGFMEAFYKPEREAMVPVFQASNAVGNDRVAVQFDNLEIYLIPKERVHVPMPTPIPTEEPTPEPTPEPTFTPEESENPTPNPNEEPSAT